MIKALEGFTATWYTPEGQGDDKPTRFKIQPLDGEQLGEVADYLTVENGQLYIASEGRNRCLKYGLVDWENFNDSNGPIMFNVNNMRLIPHVTRTALAVKIFGISELTGEQEKN